MPDGVCCFQIGVQLQEMSEELGITYDNIYGEGSWEDMLEEMDTGNAQVWMMAQCYPCACVHKHSTHTRDVNSEYLRRRKNKWNKRSFLRSNEVPLSSALVISEHHHDIIRAWRKA